MMRDDIMPAGVALVGYRGTGKSTVGRLLAERLGLPFVDADAALERRFGQTIRDTFATLGEPVFRDREAQVLEELAAGPPAVIATGGGAILRESNRQALRSFGLVVWLSARPEVLAERLRTDPASVSGRPALTASGTIEEIAEVLAYRTPLYAAAADVEVSTEGRTPEAVVEAVLDVLPPRLSRPTSPSPR